MDHVIILSTSDIIVIAVCWTVVTFINGFLRAWFNDRFDAKHIKRIDEVRKVQKEEDHKRLISSINVNPKTGDNFKGIKPNL